MKRTTQGSIYYPSVLSIGSNVLPQRQKWCSRWWQKTKLFFWNSNEKTCMGKRCLEWFLILLYYAFFFLLIIGLFAVMLVVGMKLLANYKKPKFGPNNAEIKKTPGLSFRPSSGFSHYSTIWFKCPNQKDTGYKSYIHSIQNFLHDYSTSAKSEHFKANTFDINKLENCSVKNYGYDVQKPCIYLKLNKMIDWKPECYNESYKLPKDMPHLLKIEVIKQLKLWGHQENIIWVWCDGDTPSDKQHLGRATYYPMPGFQSHYYPFKGEQNFKPPIVAVQFSEIEPGVLVSVKCLAWAKNIDNTNGRNGARFHILAPLKPCNSNIK